MTNLKKILKYISLLLLLAYLGMGLFLYLYQRDFLYYPTPHLKSQYKEMKLHNDGESINVIVLNEGLENAILYFGGNAESMVKSSDYIAGQFPKSTIYLMDYRGFGSSTGVPTEKNIYLDALTLYDTVKSKHKSISVGGRSLGTGVATYVAAHREVYKLALITPYDSVVNVAQGRYPLYPIDLIADDKYDSLGRVGKIKAKTFIILAENDEVIPREYSQKLINAFNPDQLEVCIIKNRGHIDISSDVRYYRAMQDFMGEGRANNKSEDDPHER